MLSGCSMTESQINSASNAPSSSAAAAHSNPLLAEWTGP
jgi:hypothetical protein